MRWFVTILFSAICLSSSAQLVPGMNNTTIAVLSGGFALPCKIYLPPMWTTANNNKYPVIFSYHGSGEAGNSNGSQINLLDNTGLIRNIDVNNETPTAVNPINSQRYYYIVVAVQASSYSAQPSWLHWMFNDLAARLVSSTGVSKIDSTRIYAFGYSAGGLPSIGNITELAGTADTSYSKLFAAICPMSPATQDITKANLKYIGLDKCHVLTVTGSADQSSYTAGAQQVVDSTNHYNAGSAQAVLITGAGHCCWDQWTDTAFSIPGVGLTMLQWFLQFTTSPPNQPPTVNAGNNQSITLPVNSVTLTGTASANSPATSITSTTWSELSGPNSATITSPSNLSTSVGGMIQGTYTFQLAAVDNLGGSNSATTQVVVNGAGVKPNCSAGVAQFIQLTTSGAFGSPSLQNGVSGNTFVQYFDSSSQWSSFCTPQVLHAFKLAGVESFRIPLDPYILFDTTHPGTLNVTHVVSIDTIVIAKMIDSGFTVILDGFHLLGGPGSAAEMHEQFVDTTNSPTGMRLKIRQYNVALLNYFKHYPASQLLFEIENEPGDAYSGADTAWYNIQDSIVSDMRKIDTVHWFTVCGTDKVAGEMGLNVHNTYPDTLPKLPYSKLVYTFHFYQPNILVFQGKNGANDQGTYGLCYPCTQPQAQHITDSVAANCPGCNGAYNSSGIGTLGELWTYGHTQVWNTAFMDSIIHNIAQYGSNKQVPIWMGEGNCYEYGDGVTTGTLRGPRLNWYRDMTAVCRKYNIGYNVWDPIGTAVRVDSNLAVLPPIKMDTALITTMEYFPVTDSATATVVLSGTASGNNGASIVSTLWSAVVNPNGAVIASPGSLTTSVAGVTAWGNDVFRLIATDNNGLKDTSYTHVQFNPICNTNAPRNLTLALTQTSPTGEIYRPTTAQSVTGSLGADTLTVPLNGGTPYDVIDLGNISGDQCNYTVIYFTPGVTIHGRIVVDVHSQYLKFVGNGTHIVGAGGDGTDMNGFNHIEFTGFIYDSVPAGAAILAKYEEDTSKIETLYNNYLLNNLYIHDLTISRTQGNGLYIGPTNPSGTDPGQPPGVPNRLDSVHIKHVHCTQIGQTGISVSAGGYGNLIDSNFVYQAGTVNGSQNFFSVGIILGGSSKGNILYDTMWACQAAGLQVFSFDTVNIAHNVFDSCGKNTGNQGGHNTILLDDRPDLEVTNPPGMYPVIDSNQILYPQLATLEAAIQAYNSNGTMLSGHVFGNTFCIPGLSNGVSVPAGYITMSPAATLSNNTIQCGGAPVLPFNGFIYKTPAVLSNH